MALLCRPLARLSFAARLPVASRRPALRLLPAARCWAAAAHADSSVRRLSDSWLAVHSEEHRRDYYWNEASGETTWDLPPGLEPVSSSPPSSSSTGAASALEGGAAAEASDGAADADQKKRRSQASDDGAAHAAAQAADAAAPAAEAAAPAAAAHGDAQGEPLVALRRAVEDGGASRKAAKEETKRMLATYETGEELQPRDFDLVMRLVHLRRQADELIGEGVRAVKVDFSTPGQTKVSKCFWLLRTDGSERQVSVGRCLAALGSRLAEGEARPGASSSEASWEASSEVARDAGDAGRSEDASAAGPAVSSAQAEGAADAPKLPAGWSAIFSEEHGRDYYWHKASGEVTWDPPAP